MSNPEPTQLDRIEQLVEEIHEKVVGDGGPTDPPPPTEVIGVRAIPVSPAGGLGQFNMSDNDYVAGFRFELDQDRAIDRWYFSINGEGSNLIGGRDGYGHGTGGTWYGRIVQVNQETGLPTNSVVATETVPAATAHSRARDEFDLNLTHQIHWIEFNPVTLEAGKMYAFLLSNTDPNPGDGGSGSTGNHMSPNYNFAELDEMGPNGANTLDPDAPGAMYGYTPRETTLWSNDGGGTWEFGDRVGWYQVGTGRGRMWVVGYRISGGVNVAHGWPCMNWPSDNTSGVSITYHNVPETVTITQAGGCNDGGGSIGTVTVTNTSTGQSSNTQPLGAGKKIGNLSAPVTVEAGQSYRLSCSGQISMGSPTSGQGAVFDLGDAVPYDYTLSSGNQIPMLFALPHPFFTEPTSTPPPSGSLQAPTNFTATLNSNRSVTARWIDPTGAFDAIEVHEFLADPDTLAATVAPGVQERTSGVLTGGDDYSYAARTKKGNEYSAFTPQVTLYVPTEDEDVPEDPPPGGGDPGDPPPDPDPGTHPSDVIDLSFWTIMLPTGSQGDPDNEYVIDRSIPNTLFVRQDGGVVFRCPANGNHSPNSKYSRTEARQMLDNKWNKAAWSSSGDHSLELVLSIDTSHLESRRRVNGMQIHDGGDDVCQVMLHEEWGLGLMHNDGNSWVSIDPDYVDGTKFRCKIQAVNNRLLVFYNGVKKVDISKSGSSWYWKFGCYNQSGGASEYEEPDSAYGEVVVWEYTMTGGGS